MVEPSNNIEEHYRVVPLLIEGKEIASKPSSQFPVYSYEQQKIVGFAESANAASAKLAADAATSAFKTWKDVSAVARRELLQRYAALIRGSADKLVAMQKLETSAPEVICRKNIELATALIEETAACITSLKGEVLPTADNGTLALALTVPVGPVLVIAPWNSPVVLGARNIAVAVAAGCTAVFKASENCPKLHHMIVEIFSEAGLPDGVVNVIQASRENAVEVTEAVISHPGIKKVEFVGSAAVGKSIGQLCSKYLKPIFMELGGKSPAIVLDDADLESAARKCVLGAFLHHGQICFSTERIIVLEEVAREFQQHIQKFAEAFKTTNGVATRVVEASKRKLEDAQRKGATFLVGGPEFDTNVSLKPTVVLGLTDEMELYHEEAFGPSVALFIARDDEHALEIANDTTYGLSAAVFTRSFDRGMSLARRLESGQVHINNMTVHDEPSWPVGGTKGSGWGRNNAIYGLREFCEVKTVTWSVAGLSFI